VSDKVKHPYVVTVGDEDPEKVELHDSGDGAWVAAFEDDEVRVALRALHADGRLTAEIDGIEVDLHWSVDDDGTVWLDGGPLIGRVPLNVASLGELALRDAHGVDKVPPPADPIVRCPVAGQVLSVAVAVGDAVNVGDSLLVLESMKMETTLRAPVTGRIAAVEVNPGDSVKTNAVMITLETGQGDGA